MKAILEFDLDDPNDREAFERASKAEDYWLAMREIDGWLRTGTKYASDVALEAYVTAWQKARDAFHEILADRGIGL